MNEARKHLEPVVIMPEPAVTRAETSGPKVVIGNISLERHAERKIIPTLPDHSVALYCHLLALYPTDFRAEFGPEMAEIFRCQCRDAYNECGLWGVIWVWLMTLTQLPESLGREHIDLSDKLTISFLKTILFSFRAILFSFAFLLAVGVGVAFLRSFIEAFIATFLLIFIDSDPRNIIIDAGIAIVIAAIVIIFTFSLLFSYHKVYKPNSECQKMDQNE